MKLDFIKSVVHWKKNILFYRPCSSYTAASAKVDIKGKLAMNVRSNSKVKNKTCGYLIIGENAQLKIEGCFDVMSGGTIGILNNARLTIKSGYMNYNSKIHCFKEINIGEDVVISEGVTIRDSDGHDILDGKHTKAQPINIGNHVWIGLNATILKGVTVGGWSDYRCRSSCGT